jgi:hypothetical protein
MAIFTRREKPPADVVAALPPDQRVVSWADTEDGAVVVATPKGLWWPDADGPRLIGWQYVDKAIWHDGALTVIQADVVDDAFLVDRDPVTVRLATPRDLPPTVRTRVQGNIVRSEELAVHGGSARFVSRRIPGQDGVTWWARFERGAVADEQTRAAVKARLSILRSEGPVESD